ncbi:MAG TPA: hypothetical protein VL088_09300, partial [Pedobacter sp.]|nr:hypothetical protein [Pedobacter sp.]
MSGGLIVSTTKQWRVLVAAATTFSAVCFLPTPAQATGCDFYAFPETPAEAHPYYGFSFNAELVQDNRVHV